MFKIILKASKSQQVHKELVVLSLKKGQKFKLMSTQTDGGHLVILVRGQNLEPVVHLRYECWETTSSQGGSLKDLYSRVG